MIKEITFQKTSDPFISAGISGLIKYCKKRKEDIGDIDYSVHNNNLTISSNNLNKVLLEMYYEMGKEYYDTSVKKSLDDASAFFYDENSQKIIQSKYKTFGLAYLINNSKQRTIGTIVQMKNCSDEVKKIVNQYFEKNGIKGIDPNTYEIFLNGRYTTVPQIEDIQLSNGDKVCSICGNSYKKVYESKSFSPFLGGASAGNNYVSMLKGTEKVCWKCLYLQRFSPVYAFYKMSEDLNIFIFNSNSITSMEKINTNLLKSMFYTKEQLIEANYTRNYDDFKFEQDEVKDYFNHFSEQMLMIMYTIFKKMEFVRPHIVDDNEWLDFEETVNYRTEVLYFRAKQFGNTYRPVYADKFTDIHYLFTVFKLIGEKQINLQHLLWDLKLAKSDSVNDPTIFRNQWAGAILNHKPTIGICEKIVVKNFMNPAFHQNFYSIITWLRMYETIIKYGGNKTMDDETRELAIKLGSQLGYAAKSDENPKAGKGRLIAMRKSRKLSQFLDHLIVFQGRYNICINKEILQRINEQNFDYFRQFAIISAFNSFNSNPQKEGEKK